MGADRRRAAAHPHQSDPHLQYPEDRIVRTRSFELSQVGRSVPGARSAGVSPLAERRYRLRGLLRSVALGYLFFPDTQTGWYPGATVAGLRMLAREPFDAIYSSAYPVTAHLVARTLSCRGHPPWVADYRDPWPDRPPARHPYPRRAEALEPALAREATIVAMPSPTWAAHYGALWGTDIAVLPAAWLRTGHDPHCRVWPVKMSCASRRDRAAPSRHPRRAGADTVGRIRVRLGARRRWRH
jgi:hypothetical protein